MEAVILHHAGAGVGAIEPYNQGIPVRTIVEALIGSGFGDILVPCPPALEIITHLSKVEPVLDRKPLQRYVNDMCRPDGPRVLCIDGEPGSGRQYAGRIVQSLLEPRGLLHASLAFEGWANASPKDACEDIALQLAFDTRTMPGEPGHRQATLWPQRLVNWLSGLIKQRAIERHVPDWILIDCVTSVPLSEELRDFVVSLVDALGRGSAARLVLIGAEELLPTLVFARAEKDRTSEIVRQDLSEFLVDISTRHAQRMPQDEADKLADHIFAGLPAAGEERWNKLRHDTITLGNLLMERRNGA